MSSSTHQQGTRGGRHGGHRGGRGGGGHHGHHGHQQQQQHQAGMQGGQGLPGGKPQMPPQSGVMHAPQGTGAPPGMAGNGPFVPAGQYMHNGPMYMPPMGMPPGGFPAGNFTFVPMPQHHPGAAQPGGMMHGVGSGAAGHGPQPGMHAGPGMPPQPVPQALHGAAQNIASAPPQPRERKVLAIVSSTDGTLVTGSDSDKAKPDAGADACPSKGSSDGKTTPVREVAAKQTASVAPKPSPSSSGKPPQAPSPVATPSSTPMIQQQTEVRGRASASPVMGADPNSQREGSASRGSPASVSSLTNRMGSVGISDTSVSPRASSHGTGSRSPSMETARTSASGVSSPQPAIRDEPLPATEGDLIFSRELLYSLRSYFTAPNEALMVRMKEVGLANALGKTRLHPTMRGVGVKKMTESENSFTAQMKKEKVGLGGNEEEAKTKEFRSVLNKITNVTYEKLSGQLLELITSRQVLVNAANIVYDKAADEPGFSTLYAELCKLFAEQGPQFEDEYKKKKDFRSEILNRCQSEFQRFINGGAQVDNSSSHGEKETIVEDAENRRRRRFMGIAQFTAMLFMKQVLKAKHMVNTVAMLCQTGSEEDSILAAVKMLDVAGGYLDNISMAPDIANTLQMAYSQLNQLMASVPNKTKFAIMDLLELRRRKWVRKDGTSTVPKNSGANSGRGAGTGSSLKGASFGRGGGSQYTIRQRDSQGSAQGGRQAEAFGRGGYDRSGAGGAGRGMQAGRAPAQAAGGGSTAPGGQSTYSGASQVVPATSSTSAAGKESDGRVSEVLEQKMKGCFMEYLNHGQVEEVEFSMKEYGNSGLPAKLVEIVVVHYLEAKESEHRPCRKLLVELGRKGVVPAHAVVKGLAPVWEFWEDLKCDAPKAPLLMQTLFQEMLSAGTVDAQYTSQVASQYGF